MLPVAATRESPNRQPAGRSNLQNTLRMLPADIIPRHERGKKNDLHTSRTLPTEGAAIACYEKARRRMLSPALWGKLCGKLSAEFQLTDQRGNELHRLASQNDFIRIDVPGPGTSAGKGFDWVKVEAIENKPSVRGAELSAIRVRPAKGPGSKEITHFFKATATSTFVVRREGNVVEACYHGRNEEPNTETRSLADEVRNAIVATGAIAGVSELQWQALIEAFIS